MVRLKYLLLPIAGALSAFLSFVIAAPYIKTLNRPWLKPDDPVAHFTYGTLWTNVQHAAFGALLCGSFCLILELGRRSWLKVLQSTLLGSVIGAIANSCADSGADLIGISAMRTSGIAGQFLGEIAWCILVPMALAFSITLAIGPTKQRVARAIFATVVAAPFTFIGRIAGSIIGAIMMVAKMGIGDVTKIAAAQDMTQSVPVWLVTAVFAGIALGLTMMISDKVSRKGSLRLVYGRKEFKDWSLDHTANRIGSSEVEIPIRGFKGVEPVHACIFRQGNQFIFDSQHFPGFVNGQPVSQAPLNHGDMIQLGEAQLVFYAAGAVRNQPRQHIQPQFQPQYQPQVMPQNVGVQPGIHPHGQMPIPQSQVAPTNNVNPITPAPGLQQFSLIDIAGKDFLLSQGSNTIGREVGNTVCFAANTTVSRSHAQITIDSNGVTLFDLGSANGTQVNGSRVMGSIQIQDGDTVDFGSARLVFRSVQTP